MWEFDKRGGQNGQGHASLVVSPAHVVTSIGSKGRVAREMGHMGNGGGG